MYTKLAPTVYLLGTIIVSLICFAQAIRKPAIITKSFTRRVFVGSIAAIAANLISAIAIFGLVALGDAPELLAASIVLHWLLMILALPIIPYGFELQSESLATRPRALESLWFAVPLLGIGAFIISYGVLFGAKWLLGLWEIEIVPNPMLKEITLSNKLLFAFTPAALAAALVEEVIFRLGFQGLLERAFRRFKGGPALAIVLASAIWALGHVGFVTPNGIKETQIFLVGLLLGWAKWRHGLVASIGGHLGLNALAILCELLFDFTL